MNYKLIDVDVPWVFIPLDHDDAIRIHLWHKHWYPSKADDEALAVECEKVITAAFDRLGLQYNTEAYGDVKMGNLRLCAGSDGISLPETAFVVVPSGIEKIKNPLKPLHEE